MKRENIGALYYICHLDNIVSIIKGGILSREKVMNRDIPHKDIHDDKVLSRRDKETPDGYKLNHYVNLFFQARNAMLYRLVHNYGMKQLSVLQIKPSVLDKDGVWVTDRNAAASTAEFHSVDEGIEHIDSELLKKKYWTDSDDSKQKMMAEALVPERISSSDIIGIYCPLSEMKGEIMRQLRRIPYQINMEEVMEQPDMFFAPVYRKRIGNNIFLSRGDMFFSRMQTFVISVNTKGVMGKGLASRAKYQFPDAYVRYQDDCKARLLQPGKPTLYKRVKELEKELADDASQLDPDKLNGSRWFLFFPTKRHWRDNSRLDDIEKGMQWLADNYKKEGIESIALPALGCGLGGLPWKDVGPMMCRYLKSMDIPRSIYLPMDGSLEGRYLSAEYLLNS